jgi:hypothetical protein
MRWIGEQVSLTDYRIIRRELRKLEPELLKEMRAEYRALAKPLGEQIQSVIRSTRVPSQMHTKIGRLSWDVNPRQTIQPTKFGIKTAPKRSSAEVTSLVSLRFRSAPLVLADMAGRVGNYDSRPLAKGTPKSGMVVTSGKYKGEMGYAYTYRDGVRGRVHRNNGQGRKLVEKLDAAAGRRASHMVYKGAEAALPAVRALHKMLLINTLLK